MLSDLVKGFTESLLSAIIMVIIGQGRNCKFLTRLGRVVDLTKKKVQMVQGALWRWLGCCTYEEI